jgi:hypothetical protein
MVEGWTEEERRSKFLLWWRREGGINGEDGGVEEAYENSGVGEVTMWLAVDETAAKEETGLAVEEIRGAAPLFSLQNN